MIYQSASFVDGRQPFDRGTVHPWSAEDPTGSRTLRQHVREPAKLDSQFNKSEDFIAS